ncbi:MAG TPA: hypothetical protein VF613_05435 [Longimicrobium sp.]|jgi:hypothetical protein
MNRSLPALLLLLLAGCPTASIHVPGMELRLAASPAAPRVGDTLRMTATIANPHSEPIELEARCSPPVTFSVGAADRSRTAHQTSDSWPCGVAGPRFRIAPGDSVRFTDSWVADADGAFTVTAAIGEHYVVRGERREFKMGHAFAPVTVRIVPR